MKNQSKVMALTAVSIILPLQDLQFFAAGDNNNLPVQRYETKFKDLMTAVFNKQSYFADFSPSGIEVLDGVQDNETAFSLKTSDIPVVVGEYNTGQNVGMGTGTANSSRFGPIQEIVYTKTDVPYAGTWSIHEGLDRFTVNTNLEGAVADRLELQAQAKTQLLDNATAGYLVDVAGETKTLADYSNDAVLAFFNALNAYYKNIEAVGVKTIKVNTPLYNAIADHPLNTTAKKGDVDISRNQVTYFKDFDVVGVPDHKLPEGTIALSYIKGIGKPFLGINTARTIEATDFDGKQLQGAGKYGHYVLPDNRKAIVKVTAVPPTPEEEEETPIVPAG